MMVILESESTREPEALAARARRAARMTQQAFADCYGLDVSALRNWEIGRREPDRAARILLMLIEARPVELAKLIAELPPIALEKSLRENLNR